LCGSEVCKCVIKTDADLKKAQEVRVSFLPLLVSQERLAMDFIRRIFF